MIGFATPLLIILAAAQAPGGAERISPSRCADATLASLTDLDQIRLAYARQSAAILSAALTQNTERLARMVAPDAAISIYHYDAGVVMPSKGAPAVVYLVKSIRPRRYTFVNERGLPATGWPCGKIEIKLTLNTIPEADAFVATFRFDGGVLVGIDAQDVDTVAGELPLPVH